MLLYQEHPSFRKCGQVWILRLCMSFYSLVIFGFFIESYSTFCSKILFTEWKYLASNWCYTHLIRTIKMWKNRLTILDFSCHHNSLQSSLNYSEIISGNKVLYSESNKTNDIKIEFNFNFSIFSSVRRSPTMRPQQDFSRSFCSCCCPSLLSCSFLVPLGLLSHYLSTSLVVFLCFLFPPLVHIALCVELQLYKLWQIHGHQLNWRIAHPKIPLSYFGL